MKCIKTVIAEDHHIFMEGLKTILKIHDDFEFEIAGEAQSGKELLQVLPVSGAELLFLDLNLPEGDGLEVLPKIRSKFPELKIIALTMFDDPKIVKSSFKAGIDGYILKGNSIEEIFEGVDEVMSGNTFMGKGVVLNVLPGEMKNIGRKKEKSAFRDKFLQRYNLTTREIEVLQLISQAFSNKEIAQALFISDQTVSVHRKNIMRKLGVSNTAALLKVAFENDLV